MKYQLPQPHSYSAETAATITRLKNRIKRLEEAGGQLMMWIGEDISDSNRQLLEDHWNKAKEAKP